MTINKTLYIFNFNKLNINKKYSKTLIKYIIHGFYRYLQINKFSENIFKRIFLKDIFRRIYLKEHIRRIYLKELIKRYY